METFLQLELKKYREMKPIFAKKMPEAETLAEIDKIVEKYEEIYKNMDEVKKIDGQMKEEKLI